MNCTKCIFCISFIIYLLIGLVFTFNTKLVYHPDYICDLFLGFDNLMHYTSTFRHPLLKGFPILGNWLYQKYNATTVAVVISIINSILLALQNCFVYRFNTEIIKLSKVSSLLVLTIFASFTANMLNIIAFDSFIFTSLLFVMLLYFYFKENTTRTTLYIISVLQIGTTISQFFKILFLALRKHFSGKVTLVITGIFLGLAYAAFFYFQDQYHFLKIISYHNVSTDFQKLAKNFYSLKTGSVFLFPELIVQKTLYLDNSYYNIVLGSAGNVYRNTILFFLLLLCTFSIYKNRNNKIVKVILPLFFIDIFIHIIVGYGNKELYLFSSHYQFIFYILLALLIKNYENKLWINPLFISVLVLLLFYNIGQFYILFEFGKNYYP